MMELSDLFLNLDYIFIAFAFLMRNILYLRILTIFSSVFAIAFFLFVGPKPAWFGISWESVFITINIFQIILLFYERRKIAFSKEEQEIYQKVFPHFLPGQYKKLLNISTFAEADKGEILIEQGAQVPYLILIYKGMTSIIINGKTVNYCGSGSLLGEMSFLSGEPARATVQATQPTKYIMWHQQDLRKLLQHDHEMSQVMQTVFNKDLIKKLTTPLTEQDRYETERL